MLIEERIYDIAVGLVSEYVDNYTENGLPVSLRHGLKLGAYFLIESGNIHQVVHYWVHEGLGKRQQMRVSRDADADWRNYQAGARGRVVKQEVRFHDAS